MSYVFPGKEFTQSGTQPIDPSSVLKSIEDWSSNYGDGISGAPTYKANNHPAAYFKFMKIQDQNLRSATNEFVRNPDLPKFNDVRKYMIVLANILMSEFNDWFELGARQIDYRKLCEEDGQPDLVIAFSKWSEEIGPNNCDPDHRDVFTEIYAKVDDVDYPIAFYSDSSLRIFPRNMINPAVTSKFIGWDPNPAEGLNNYTMKAFKEALDNIPPGPRILYAELLEPGANFAGIHCVDALSTWLANNYQVTNPDNNKPIQLKGDPKILIVDGTKINLNIPRYSPPYGIGTNDCPIFSERLLIIKSNKNVEENKYGFCKVDGTNIGRTKNEKYAVVPPISETLINIMRQNSDCVRFKNCSIERSSGNSYKAVITLVIDGSEDVHTNIYLPGDVSKCNNFPLITVLSQGTKENPFPAILYRCNYPKAANDPQSYIDGSSDNFTLGILSASPNDDGYELKFGSVLPHSGPEDFRYLGVRYHDNSVTSTTISFGYLFFDSSKSLFNAAANASSSAAIIDDENNVAKIAVWDDNNNSINAYDVYNDKIMFITDNGREDFKYQSNKVWGIPNETIFSLENGAKYAIAPFSLEFSKMIAESNISIKSANLQQNGNKWEFQVVFTDSENISQKAPVKVYDLKDQYTCTNAPFIWAVETLNDETVDGYEIVLVQNMRPTRTGDNIIDSNKLIFKMDRNELNPSQFIRRVDNNDAEVTHAYIQIFGGVNNSVFYGQIGIPIKEYKWEVGFNPDLQDKETGCAAVLLVNDIGPTSPKQIITGRVFDDNLLFVQKEDLRKNSPEYKAWRESGLFVDIVNLPDHFSNKKNYEALFPFSFKMLQNLKNNYLKIDLQSVSGKPKIVYDEVNKLYHVSVSILSDDKNQSNPIKCEMNYREDKVLKCDNMPFIVSLDNPKANTTSLIRFDNNFTVCPSMHNNWYDGSLMNIEYIDDDNKAYTVYKSSVGDNQDAKYVPISSSDVILRFNIDGIECHALYKARPSSFKEGVYAVQSDITGVQHIFDFSTINGHPVVKEINVFTDYIMYTTTMAGKFANNAECINLGKHGGNEYRMYSIPITMEFSELMEKRGIDIASYNDVKYYTDASKPDGGVIDGDMLDGLYVEVSLTGIDNLKIVKKFSSDHILRFEHHPLPTLTVFPFVNFIVDDTYGEEMEGKNLWNEYSYARFMPKSETASESIEHRSVQSGEPLGSRVEFWINGKRVNFQRRNTCIMEKDENPDKIIMEIAKVNGWGNYIHMKYDGSSRFAAAQPVDAQWNDKELGCIMMKPAAPNSISKKRQAEVGVDFGTRNSIIAIKPPGKYEPTFPYHGNNGKFGLQKTIVPCMSEKPFEEFSNLSYIPYFEARDNMNAGEGKFSSTVMLYSDAMRNFDFDLIPYDTGFVPNVKGDVLNKLMERLNENGTMGDVLGFYSDLKIFNGDEEEDRGRKEIMNRNVNLFIKSLIFHIVLNCYMKNCGRINIRISLPSEQFVASMKEVWTNAVEYIDEVFPEEARGNITIGEYATEADALFKYLQLKQNTISKYSAITDGGDGTYDFTINEFDHETKVMKNLSSFSLRYAGKQIMTDSVNVFYDHLVSRNGKHDDNVKKKFMALWDAKNKSETEKQNLDKLVRQVGKYHIEGSRDYEGEKTVVLMLIEQFGIDCSKLINPQGRTFLELVVPTYQNFVRMIQYKFLFLFNVLGEQIRKRIDFSQTREQSFDIFLYGGTAQALAIIEPSALGDIQKYRGDQAYNLLMVNYINSFMALPNNLHNQPVLVRFIPAENPYKKEIASGLIDMNNTTDRLNNFNDVERVNAVVFGGLNDGNNNGSPFGSISNGNPFGNANSGLTNNSNPFAVPSGNGSPFGNNPFAPSASNNVVTPVESAEETRRARLEEKYPKTIDEFINYLKKILKERTVPIPNQGRFSIDRFLPFLDKAGNPILFSQILDDENVRRNMQMQMATTWTSVLTENASILDDPDLIFHIFTLKMVGNAIETYLKL